MVLRPHACRSAWHFVVISRVGKVSHLPPDISVLADIDCGRYIEETVNRDRAEFKPVPHVNPFLEDFTDQGDT